MVRIKICGLTQVQDALCAADVGADLLGFVFYIGSPRYVSWQAARTMAAAAKDRRPEVLCVGLFVDAPAALIGETLDFCGLDLAQLHGDEPLDLAADLGRRAYRAIRPRSAAELDSILRRYGARPAPPDLLYDTYVAGQPGGTGQVGDWSLAAELAAQRRILLAGGLTPHNVAQAIERVRPWGVDVSSGVEEAPGRKSQAAIRQFIAAVRQWETRMEQSSNRPRDDRAPGVEGASRTCAFQRAK